MFLTTYYNNFIYVYKYACLVKLKYLQYLVNWTCTRPYCRSNSRPFAIAVRGYNKKQVAVPTVVRVPPGAQQGACGGCGGGFWQRGARRTRRAPAAAPTRAPAGPRPDAAAGAPSAGQSMGQSGLQAAAT